MPAESSASGSLRSALREVTLSNRTSCPVPLRGLLSGSVEKNAESVDEHAGCYEHGTRSARNLRLLDVAGTGAGHRRIR